MAKSKGGRQRQEERRERRVRIAMSVFIIAIMVFSTLAFVLVFYAPTEGAQDTQFTIEDGQLYANIDGEPVPFFSYPDQSIVVPQEALSLLDDSEAIIVLFDPRDTENLPYVELIRWDVSELLDKQSGGALIAPSDKYPFAVAGCDQATPEAPFIQVVNGTQSISVNDSCITMSGQQQELLYLRDQLLYAYFGVN